MAALKPVARVPPEARSTFVAILPSLVALLRAATAQAAMLTGCIALFAGVGLIVIAIAAESTALFLAGGVIAGTGFGLAFLGNIRAVIHVAAAAQRAGVLAVLHVVSYLMSSIPIGVAGMAETDYSAHSVALVFSGCVTALAGIGSSPRSPGRGQAGGGTRDRPAVSRPRLGPALPGPARGACPSWPESDDSWP